MAHYGTLKNAAVISASEDVRGSALFGANDEKLGKIDDVIFDHSNADIRYLVIDTGGWLDSKKFLVPAERLYPSAKHPGDLAADLTRQRIESFPPYQESDLESESKWGDYDRKLRAKWVADPVMHRAETDRNLTPTAYQEKGNPESERAQAQIHGSGLAPKRPAVSADQARAARADWEAAGEITERAVAAGTDSVVIDNSAVGIGQRWDTFQSRLRERRKQAVAHCRTCAGESAVERGSDSADTLRKAV